jgi:prophage DNA circulation protein
MAVTVDEFEVQLLDAEWAGIPLDILDTSDDFSRTLAQHEYPNVDGASLEDMGAVPRETACTLVFIPPEVLTRVAEFLLVVAEGKAYRFTHPLFGTYLARPRGVRVAASGADRDYVTISCTFIEDASEGVTFVEIAGEDELANVYAAAAEADAALAAAGTSSTVPTEASELADSWSDSTELYARQVNLEVAEMANKIQDLADSLELAADVANYPLVRSITRLHNNLRNLAAFYVSTAPKLTTYTVPTDEPLISICQRLYGGADALAKCERLLELNDIPNPGLVVAGTVITIEVP